MSAKQPGTDLFQYTSGRWLWDEEQQLRDRFSPFNVPELQKVAAGSVGANDCIEITKLAEGSFNKSFRLRMDNGKHAIARIPHPIAGPQYYTTASEVATMEFARSVLEIPVPQVHAWSADVNNPVGSEYIIMEEAAGVKLADIWDDLSLEQRITIMEDLVILEKKMISVSFNSYGNLYYSNEAIPGAAAAEIMGDVPAEVKNTVMHKFMIGPVVDRAFWNKERAMMNIDRGPWKHPRDLAVSPARRELEWIKQYAVPKPQDDPLVTSVTQSSPSSHISMLDRYLQVAPYLLPSDHSVTASHLWHTDLHSANIFVENGHISSVIDWQGIWAAPLILQARHPRLVYYKGDIILEAPANFKDLEPDEKNKVREQMSRSIILYLYEKQIAKDVPLLDKVIRFPYGRTRCEPILFVGDTWDDDILPLRESLIRIEKYWDKLGFDFPCPIHFTEDELRVHAEEGEGWNDVQDFWDSVAFIISRDGWTPHHLYDDAVALFTELRETSLKSMKGKEREDFYRQTQWIEERGR
ncbi:kinase-like domain-containing protein [Aspergillus taichungensis]|uniref:Altered inheritance of mitochondria protein 9, mitochondrial n=1 Tax=Aspergillus taichungensis TaxID=482145 RepID=A0A2J5I806_9EURO|nr:kinase-like domain-containing protein [Aspergillus taichungensis]